MQRNNCTVLFFKDKLYLICIYVDIVVPIDKLRKLYSFIMLHEVKRNVENTLSCGHMDLCVSHVGITKAMLTQTSVSIISTKRRLDGNYIRLQAPSAIC